MPEPLITPGPLLTWATRRRSRAGRWMAGILLVATTGPLALLAGAAALAALGLVVDRLVGGSGPLAAHAAVGILVAWAAAIAIVIGIGSVAARWLAPRWTSRLSPDDRTAASTTVVDAGTAQPPPTRLRSRASAAEAAVYLGIALLLLWPIWLHPTTRFVGVHLDPPYYVWLGWRFGEAFRSGQFLPTHLTGAVHPFGIDTALLDGLLPSWIGGFFNLLTGPFLAYNLTLLAGILADLAAARYLARTLSPRRVVWIASAAAFATAPALAGRLSLHLPFVFAFTLPLLLAEGIVVARGDRAYRPGRVTILLVVAYLCSAYFLVFGALLLVLPVLIARLWPEFDRQPADAARAAPSWRGLGRTLGLAVILTLVVLSPFLVARFSYAADERRAGGTDQLDDDAVTYAADALGPLTPPEQLSVPEPFPDVDRGSPLSKWAPAFGGLLLLGGLSAGLLLRFRVRRALLGTAAACWVLCLGPSLKFDGHVLVTGPTGAAVDWLPYRLVLAVPGLGGLRGPDRVAIALCAVLAALAAVGLTWAGGLGTRRRTDVLVGAVVVVGVGFNLMLPTPTLDLGISPPIHEALVQVRERGTGPDDAVLMVPADCDRVDPDTIALQIVHHRPSLGCSTSAASIRWQSGLDPWADSAPLASLRCDQSIISRRATAFTGDERLDEAGVAELADDLGVRFVIIDEGAAALCPGVAASLPALRAHEVIGADDRYTVIDLASPLPESGS